MTDRNYTLAQLQSIRYNPEDYSFRSGLVMKLEELIFRKKVRDFTIEDLRILIGQNESLSITIPMAIEQLSVNPMAEGDYYPGDLLKVTLCASPQYWATHEKERAALEDIVIKNKDKIFNFDTTDEIKNQLREAFHDFLLM